MKDKKMPSLDEIIKDNPPTQREINIQYADEEEEEEIDAFYPLEKWEEPFYDENGKFIDTEGDCQYK